MPGWHKATQAWREEKDLVLIGVIQEQHAERCQLFAQWRKFDWPILHDPINRLGLRAVPVPVAIDEHGVVRSTRPSAQTFEASFLRKTFEAPKDRVAKRAPRAADLKKLASSAAGDQTAKAWREYGDALVLWAPARSGDALAAYARAAKLEPADAGLQFRLGVAHRMRFESPKREPGDFQKAIDHWGRALELDPNQYIYRRRIQQYGPRLDKPYPFYDWVETAKKEIAARGDTPIALPVEPSGAEIASPLRKFAVEEGQRSPDPLGRITRDKGKDVELNAVVVPTRVTAGGSARIHVDFRPRKLVHWNNEAEPLRVWVEPPEGWSIERRLFSAPMPRAAESRETRRVEFELKAPRDAKGPTKVLGYALYYVCEESEGVCYYRRQDFSIPLKAPR